MKKAKKSLGQNFLIDKNICNKIVKLSNIQDNVVLEIGPGYGILTDAILKQKPKCLYLIEKDKNLLDYLIDKYKNKKNIQFINIDFMDFNLINFSNIIIISNLPYNISTKIILKLFKFSQNINQAILMLQKEVALKFDYKISKLNKYKFLNQNFCDYLRCFNVPKTVFKPRPKIESTVVKFKFKANKIDFEKANNFANLIFKNKRKIISNKIPVYNKNIINLIDKRVDEINMNEILRIYNSF